MTRHHEIAVTLLLTALIAWTPQAAFGTTDLAVGSSGRYVSGLDQHRYGKLNGTAHADVLFVNIESTAPWRQVANGGQDANVKRWARTLKGTGTRLVSFSHEPMSKANRHLGTQAQFIAAWRHVVRVFDRVGADNVEWVWNATSHSFRGAHPTGQNWYPGDAWVDDVAGESYNRIGCGFSSPKSFGSQIKEILAFAKKHHKRFVAAEFASNRGSARAQWLRDARRFVVANRSAFRGVFYYNSTNRSAGCDWLLNSAEKNILRTFGSIR